MARRDQKPAEVKEALVAKINASRGEIQREWNQCRNHWAPHRIVQRSMKSHLGWWLGGAALGGLKLASTVLPSKKSKRSTKRAKSKMRPLRHAGKLSLLFLKPSLLKFAQRQASLWLNSGR